MDHIFTTHITGTVGPIVKIGPTSIFSEVTKVGMIAPAPPLLWRHFQRPNRVKCEISSDQLPAPTPYTTKTKYTVIHIQFLITSKIVQKITLYWFYQLKFKPARGYNLHTVPVKGGTTLGIMYSYLICDRFCIIGFPICKKYWPST